MPVYEYECPEHGKFEILIPFALSNQSTAPCPQCTAPSGKVVSNISIGSKSFRGTNQGEWALQNVIRERQELGLSIVNP